MKKGLVRGMLKIGAVLFSVSLLLGYVWFEQNRAGGVADDGWTVELDEELIEEVSFSADEHFSNTNPFQESNTAVLMPSSKSMAMPIFRKGDSRLDLFKGDSEDGSKMDVPRALMHSSKLTVIAVPRMNDWDAKNVDTEGGAEISGSNLEFTLDTEHATGSNTLGSAWKLNDPETEDDILIRKALLGSSKSGIISFSKGDVEVLDSGDIVVTTKTREAKPVPEETQRAVIPSSKSGPVLIDGKFIFLPKKEVESNKD